MHPEIGSSPDLYHLPGFHEPFSALSHLVGAVVFLFLGYALFLRGRGERRRLVYLGIYAAACVLLFSMSGVYHMLPRGGVARNVLGRLDHSAIFVLIAGTFTPIHGLLFRGFQRWGPLVVIWGAALLGICLKSIYFDALPDWFTLALYLTMGWFGAYGGVLLARRYGFRFIAALFWGGVAYSIGAIFEELGWFVVVPGVVHPHEVFHVAVLAGAVCHWYFVWQFAASPARKDGVGERDAASLEFEIRISKSETDAKSEI